MNKPKCAVHGSLEGGRARCGSVIVGGIFCGAAGECEHKGAITIYPKCSGQTFYYIHAGRDIPVSRRFFVVDDFGTLVQSNQFLRG